jgi:uncharacterized cupin superfamily protein
VDWNNIINVYDVAITPGDPVASAPHYQSGSAEWNSRTMGAKQIAYDIRVIPPGKMAVPYHFHHQKEELFLILEGEATLRQNDHRRIVRKGDLLFFATGPQGAHQLFNHTQEPVRYLDLVTLPAGDVCEYPDSDKVNCGGIYQKKDQVDYFAGEGVPSPFWSELQP